MLVLAAISAFMVVVALPGVGADVEYPTIPTWPQFVMEYETDGHAVSVGQNTAKVLREVRRLDYVSRTEWNETVLEAPTVQARVGAFDRIGSYNRLDGSVFTEYNALTDTTQQKEVEEGRVAGPFMLPFPIEESGYEFTLTTTEATVCFMGECQENAEGLLYRRPSGTELVFVNDARGIPLRINDGFIVREIRINDGKQPVGEFGGPGGD